LKDVKNTKDAEKGGIMKIAVTSKGRETESEIDLRFGRCAYFIIFDTETGAAEPVENIGADSSTGAGVKAAQAAVSQGVEAVITGKAGPNAAGILKAAGIKIYTCENMTIDAALKEFEKGGLLEASDSAGTENKIINLSEN